jgi:hypothetical protein
MGLRIRETERRWATVRTLKKGRLAVPTSVNPPRRGRARRSRMQSDPPGTRPRPPRRPRCAGRRRSGFGSDTPLSVCSLRSAKVSPELACRSTQPQLRRFALAVIGSRRSRRSLGLRLRRVQPRRSGCLLGRHPATASMTGAHTESRAGCRTTRGIRARSRLTLPCGQEDLDPTPVTGLPAVRRDDLSAEHATVRSSNFGENWTVIGP